MLRQALFPQWNEVAPFVEFVPTTIVIGWMCGWMPSIITAFYVTSLTWMFPHLPDDSDQYKLISAIVEFAACMVIAGAVINGRNALKRSVANTTRSEVARHELGHRVQNLFAVTQSMISLARRFHPDDPNRVLDDISDRIDALARANSVIQNSPSADSFLLTQFIDTLMAPYRTKDSGHVVTEGPEMVLPALMMTPLGLFLHEIATNSVKYGALSDAGGRLDVHWSQIGDILRFEWTETLPAGLTVPPQTREGFGSVVLKTSVQQLQATLERDLKPSGLELSLEIPLDLNQD